MKTEQMSLVEIRAAHKSEADPIKRRKLYAAEIDRTRETYCGTPRSPAGCKSDPYFLWMEEYIDWPGN